MCLFRRFSLGGICTCERISYISFLLCLVLVVFPSGTKKTPPPPRSRRSFVGVEKSRPGSTSRRGFRVGVLYQAR